MLPLRVILVGFISGALIAGGWWLFFDGIVYAPDAFPWLHVLPPIGSMITFICLNLANYELMVSAEHGPCVRIWIFFFLVLGCVSIGVAIWITAIEYPLDIASNWPGIAIVLQTTMILLASILFFVGKSMFSGNDTYKYAL